MLATRIKQLSPKYTVILTRFPMSQSFDSCYIWRLLFCFVLQALSPVMTTLKTLKCSSNWPKWLFVTHRIRFGNHDLEIRSDVSSFSAADDLADYGGNTYDIHIEIQKMLDDIFHCRNTKIFAKLTT